MKWMASFQDKKTDIGQGKKHYTPQTAENLE